MKWFWPLLLAGALAPFPCGAAQTPPPAIDPALCQALTKHAPAADVAFQPGIDVRGRPVVPADLEDGAQPLLPNEISIPLTADLMSFLGVDRETFPFEAMKRNDISLGTLTVRGDAVFLNGQPLTSAQQDNLAVLCLQPTKAKVPPPPRAVQTQP